MHLVTGVVTTAALKRTAVEREREREKERLEYSGRKEHQ
jgi:hypothetical protein